MPVRMQLFYSFSYFLHIIYECQYLYCFKPAHFFSRLFYLALIFKLQLFFIIFTNMDTILSVLPQLFPFYYLFAPPSVRFFFLTFWIILFFPLWIYQVSVIICNLTMMSGRDGLTQKCLKLRNFPEIIRTVYRILIVWSFCELWDLTELQLLSRAG